MVQTVDDEHRAGGDAQRFDQYTGVKRQRPQLELARRRD